MTSTRISPSVTIVFIGRSRRRRSRSASERFQVVAVPANRGDLVYVGFGRLFLANDPAVVADVPLKKIQDGRDVAYAFAERLPVITGVRVLQVNVNDARGKGSQRVEQVLAATNDMPGVRIPADELRIGEFHDPLVFVAGFENRPVMRMRVE